MGLLRPLLSGVAVCRRCARIWEVHLVRPEDAICHCGVQLELEPEPWHGATPQPLDDGPMNDEESDEES